MADFIRARSEEQKAQRMADIKNAADALFATLPYHAITMSSIAEALGWTRTKLYKYVTTKEDIYLELCADKRAAYFDALMAAAPAGSALPQAELAARWAAVLAAHRDYLCYSDILLTIIETNVTVERLAAFKTAYYRDADRLCAHLGALLHTPPATINAMLPTIHCCASGLCCGCADNPLVQQALDLAGIERPKTDFCAELQDFIAMELAWHCR